MSRKKNKDEELDILLGKAFEEYVRREDESLPSDEELREAFPPSEEDCLKYGKAAKRKERGSAALKVLRRVAVIVLVLISASSAALMLNKNVRAAVTGTIYRVVDDYIWVRFTGADDEISFFDGKDMSDLNIGYIPEGLILCYDSRAQNWPDLGYRSRTFIICDPDDETAPGKTHPPYIMLCVQDGDQESGYSDEALEISHETTVNGMPALMYDVFYYYDGEDHEVVRLEYGDKNFTVYIQSGEVSGEEVKKVAESLG